LLVSEWKKYAAAFGEPAKNPRMYLLPGSSTYKICRTALAKLIGKERHAWDSIEHDTPEREHGLSRRLEDRMTGNQAADSETIQALHQYFESLSKLGAPRSTGVVTSLVTDKVVTELKDADTELVELPACHSKQSLYRSFLLECGWEVALTTRAE
jgi:hypothetical protein